MYGFFLS
jgi:ubiquitin C